MPNKHEKAALAAIASQLPPERAQGCRTIASLFTNGGSRWAIKHAKLFLEPLLALGDELPAKRLSRQ